MKNNVREQRETCEAAPPQNDSTQKVLDALRSFRYHSGSQGVCGGGSMALEMKMEWPPLVTLLALLQDGQGSERMVGLRDEGSHLAGQGVALVL